MEHNRIKRFNENSELNISDVRNSDFDEISDEILRYFEKLGDAKSRNKEELDDELKKIIETQNLKNMDKDNKNTEVENTDKKLHISDVSDSDFILGEIRTILKKKEEDMLWYIKEYFSKDEINRHSENLLRMVSGIDGDIAEIKMKLIGKNHYH